MYRSAPAPGTQRPDDSSTKFGLLKTSLTYQTEQFFENSTLHGVRYIREEGRPFCEKFMWFCFTSIGGVATLIIIVSLWEKFQTNPTITGLDTDFHNWDVPFPAVSLCISDPSDQDTINAAYEKPEEREYVKLVTNFSYGNLPAFGPLLDKSAALSSIGPLKEIQLKYTKKCQNVFISCEFKGDPLKCCDHFRPLATEMGFCYVFNSRHAHNSTGGGTFEVEYIRETDEKWALGVMLTSSMRSAVYMVEIYIHSNDDVPVLDTSPQHQWQYINSKLFFSAKQTYTTEDARQLSIRQRRCVFREEIKLDTDSMYTYSACMTQCRMRLAKTLCGCVPFFYGTAANHKVCDYENLKCLVEKADTLLNHRSSCNCDLGCMNTVYDVEKLQTEGNGTSIELSFVSWPMVRYKREVLFGWVDLLVSFGGIAGLFLGFSLLSGVELVYYFTMRACCMVFRNQDELRRLQDEYSRVERPPLDLSLTPYFLKEKEGAMAMGLTKVQPGTLIPRNFSELRVPRQPQNLIHHPTSFEFLL